MEQEHWGWRRRSIAEVLWPSFLAAAVGTMVFFAWIDPDLLVMAAERQTDWSHTAIYSVGFFFFWALTALASGLTTWLIRTERRKADFPHEQPPQQPEQEQG